MSIDYKPQTWKIRVKQEYDVYLYFQEGLIAEDDEELYEIVTVEAVNAAFGEDGLTAVLHEQTDSSNGYLAFVETYEPEADILYNYKDIPNIIKQALEEKGLLNDKKN